MCVLRHAGWGSLIGQSQLLFMTKHFAFTVYYHLFAGYENLPAQFYLEIRKKIVEIIIFTLNVRS